MSQNEMYLKIRVRDYGIGIGAGEENQIFQRFYRGQGCHHPGRIRDRPVSVEGDREQTWRIPGG